MEIKEHEYCLRCGRKLKNPVARQSGYGKICLGKLKTETKCKSLFSVSGIVESSTKLEK